VSTRPARRYPPLVAGLAALAIAAFVLPNALNVQQANPTETEQFAPVPSSGRQQPSQVGNLTSLSLGNSSTLAADGAGSGSGPGGGPPGVQPATPGLPPATPAGTGGTPLQKDCVGAPPRQTEDPLSPPCVGYYHGDNGGSTYPGVSAQVVNVLIYSDTYEDPSTDEGPEDEGRYEGRCFNLTKPIPAGINSDHLRNFGRWETYFNYRYQTYDRTVAFWLCFSHQSSTSTSRSADAAADYAAVHPFAALTSSANLSALGPFEDYLESRGVLLFGSIGMKPAASYTDHPGLAWDYQPTVEREAAAFAGYVCQRVVGKVAVDSGNAGVNGHARVLGLITTTDPAHPNLEQFGHLAAQQIEACGGHFAASVTFPTSNEVGAPVAGYAAANMATLKQKGVTTIIWAGGSETAQTAEASDLGYYPEWIIAGDGYSDGTTNGDTQSDEQWAHAWTVSYETYYGPATVQPCFVAIRQADPTIGSDITAACLFDDEYADLRQLFTGIQVAGPDLTPATMDEGYHAIPAVASTDPRVPACFYQPGDYTCIQDAVAEHWSTTMTPPDADYDLGTGAGCWQMLEDGARTLDGQPWPAGNINAGYQPTDRCNGYMNDN